MRASTGEKEEEKREVSDAGAARGPKKEASPSEALFVAAAGRDSENRCVQGCPLGSCGEASRGPLGGSFEGSWRPFGGLFWTSFGPRGGLLERLGGLLGGSSGLFGASWGLLCGFAGNVDEIVIDEVSVIGLL